MVGVIIGDMTKGDGCRNEKGDKWSENGKWWCEKNKPPDMSEHVVILILMASYDVSEEVEW